MASPKNNNLPHPDLAYVWVEGGKQFMMGNDNSEFDWEKPAHPVIVSSFHLCKYPVTQSLYEWVMPTNPSRFKGERRPVETVSWEEAQQFISALNEKTGVKNFLKENNLPSSGFRLPSEVEWEYAARGGTYTQGYKYCGSDKLKQIGWFVENSGDQTKEVGLLLPNELGLYDMSGNVYEWCEDWYGGSDYYKKCLEDGVLENPTGPDSGGRRVMRGGGSFSSPVRCRPSYRGLFRPGDRDRSIGFRLALPSQSVGSL